MGDYNLSHYSNSLNLSRYIISENDIILLKSSIRMERQYSINDKYNLSIPMLAFCVYKLQVYQHKYNYIMIHLMLINKWTKYTNTIINNCL